MFAYSLKQSVNPQSGNTLMIVLVVLVIVGVGALAYLSGQMQQDGVDTAGSETAARQDTAGNQVQEAQSQAPQAIEPGNPVVARVNGQDITRNDVFAFIQTLPEQSRQLPLEQLFPLALEQVINARLINAKTENVNVSGSQEYKQQLELAKKQIARNVFLQQEAQKRVTEDRLKEAYETYVANFPQVEEVKARHILVEDEALAGELIGRIKAGEDFAALAAEYSRDPTGRQGGELNYFLKTDVVPEFGAAVFAVSSGTMLDKPVKSQFGYHVIEVQDKRNRAPADFETVMPFLEAQLRREALETLIEDWREQASIERFSINGQSVEPAAGSPQSDDTLLQP